MDSLAVVNEHRIEDPGALGEVLDVLVAAVLPRRAVRAASRATRFELVAGEVARNRRLRQRRQRERRHPVRCRVDERLLLRSTLDSSAADGAVPIRRGARCR